MSKSSSFSISKLELQKVVKNSLVFSAPLITLYLAFVREGVSQDGFSWSDFKPNDIIIGALVLYVLNTITDFLKRFIPDTTKV